MPKAVLLYGGSHRPSRLHGVFDQAARDLQSRNFTVHKISIHDIPAEDLIETNFQSPAIVQANTVIVEADAIVVFTPVYKASFSGILKTFLDLLPQKALQQKIILPVAMGGSFGHLLAIEYALKPIFSVLGATNILNGVFVQDQQVQKIAPRQYVLEETAANRLQDGLQALADETAKYAITAKF